MHRGIFPFTYVWVFAVVSILSIAGCSSMNDMPAPVDGPPDGTSIAYDVRFLDRDKREQRIFEHVADGHLPSWMFAMKTVTVSQQINGTFYEVTFRCTPDYLTVGTDEDYFRIPLTPITAQRIAKERGYALPTPKMVDAIWQSAVVKLIPQPIPPSPEMTTVPVFEDHNGMVQTQLADIQYVPGGLIAGHKKDVVTTARLATAPGKVAIYGWHQASGQPIQPLYTGHNITYADYSHGIRFVDRTVTVNGEELDLYALLANPELAPLLSSEGVILQPEYSVSLDN